MTPFRQRIVVGGLPRAGSTLFRYLLDASESIVVGPETGFFRQPFSVQQARASRAAGRVGRALDLPVEPVERAILEARSSVAAFDGIMDLYRRAVGTPDKPAWGEKTPWNCAAYRWLALESPDLCFVSLIRDGRDVLTSRMPGEDAYHVPIQRYVEAMRFVFDFHHPRHRIVRYEDLVRDPGATMKAVFELAGLPFSESILTDYRRPAPSRDPSKVRQPKVVGGIRADWIGRWRRDEHAPRVAEAMADERVVAWLRASGYEG